MLLMFALPFLRSIPMRVGSTLQILKDLLQDPVHPCLRRGYGLNWFPHVDSAVHPCAVAAPDHPACAGDTSVQSEPNRRETVHPCVLRGYEYHVNESAAGVGPSLRAQGILFCEYIDCSISCADA